MLVQQTMSTSKSSTAELIETLVLQMEREKMSHSSALEQLRKLASESDKEESV